jgi:hypothetical protein
MFLQICKIAPVKKKMFAKTRKNGAQSLIYKRTFNMSWYLLLHDNPNHLFTHDGLLLRKSMPCCRNHKTQEMTMTNYLRLDTCKE